LKSGLEAMRHTIREVDPQRPSQRVRTFSEELRSTVARQRGVDAARLSVLLRGDLDWIVMHCLEKDRTRRYETASGLAADVRRFLSDEPVAARSPSAAYRFSKFVRRHRLGFTAGTAVVLLLIAGLVLASVSLVREQAARVREAALRKEADANAAHARTAAAKSAHVAQFMKDMLSGVGPSVALGRDTTMLREILDATARRLGIELRDQPEVAAALRETLGLVYRDLGRYAEAEPFLREVVATHRTLFGNGSAELAASLDHLGALLRGLNKLAEAETALQEALAIRRKLFGHEHPAFADTLFHLSQVPNARRSLEDQGKMLTEVLAIRRKAFGTEHPTIAETIEALGTHARTAFGHEKAAEVHAEALAMYRKLLGNDHPAVARSLDSLGYSLVHMAQKTESKEVYREAFFLRRKVLGPQHPQMVVSLLRYTGQIPAAEADGATIALVREFIAAQRTMLPRSSPLVAPSLLTLAILLDRPEQNPTEAANLVREARSILGGSLASGPPLDVEVIDAMAFYGWCKFIGGHASEGQTMNELAVELARGAFGKTHPRVMLANHILGWVYLGARRIDDAVLQFSESVRVIRATFPNHPFLAMNIAGHGAALRDAGRTADSRRVLEEAWHEWKKGSDATTPLPRSIPMVLCELGLTLNRDARFDQAEPVLRESLRLFDLGEVASVGLRVRPRARAESGLGTALAGQGKFAEAEPLVVHAFEELKANESSIGGDAGGMVREAFDAVVALYAAWEKPDKVAEWQARRP
jgi:eukaryotic-like serine/threonine-protein kinase